MTKFEMGNNIIHKALIRKELQGRILKEILETFLQLVKGLVYDLMLLPCMELLKVFVIAKIDTGTLLHMQLSKLSHLGNHLLTKPMLPGKVAIMPNNLMLEYIHFYLKLFLVR